MWLVWLVAGLLIGWLTPTPKFVTDAWSNGWSALVAWIKSKFTKSDTTTTK